MNNKQLYNITIFIINILSNFVFFFLSLLFQYIYKYYFFLNRLVIQTLKPLNSDRKCFRLIHGVLVERTIKDVLPAVENNLEGVRNWNLKNK